MLTTLAKLAGVSTEEVLRRFGHEWPEFERRCAAAIAAQEKPQEEAEERPDRSILEEILGLVRQQARETAPSPQIRLRPRPGVTSRVPTLEAVENAVQQALVAEGLEREAVREISGSPEEVTIVLGEPATDELAGHVAEGIYKRLGGAVTVRFQYMDLSDKPEVMVLESLL